MKIKNIFFSLAFLCIVSGFSQTFQDHILNETIGDFPSQWDLVSGNAIVENVDGNKVIDIKDKGIIKPIVNGETNNYLGDQFTFEFDVYFDKVPSLNWQHYDIRFWDGNSIYSKNKIIFRPIDIRSHGLQASWEAPTKSTTKNLKKEMETLEPVWRHIKVEYGNGKLKIFIDEQLFLNIPRMPFKPTMVSIGGVKYEPHKTLKGGIANIVLITPPKETKIIMLVDNQTNKVTDINLYSNFENTPSLKSKYPNTKAYFGTIYGNYNVKNVAFTNIKKPNIGSNTAIYSTDTKSVHPHEYSDIEKHQFIDVNTYNKYTVQPVKEAQMVFDFENEFITKNLRFETLKYQASQPGQPIYGDYFENNIRFSSANKDLVVNKNQMYLLPKGTEPLEINSNNGGFNNSHVLLNGSLGNEEVEEESNSENNIVLLDGEPINPNEQSPSGSAEDANLPESGVDYDKEKAFEYYQEQEALKRIEYGDPYGASGYSKLEVIDNSFVTKNESNVLSSQGEPEGSNNCVTENIVYNSNSESFSDFVLSSVPDWMLPGVFLKSRDYIKGDYNVYEEERNPIQLTINIPGSSARTTTINNPHKNGDLLTGINMLQTGNNYVSMSLSTNYEELHSKQELSFKLMGKYSNKVAQVSASLGMDFQENYHYYLFEATQYMFSIDVDNFDKANIFKELNTDILYNDLIYVSRVNYGRKAIVVVESKYDLKKIDANFEGQINTLVNKARLETSLSYLNEESNFKIKALLYGGSTVAGFNALNLSIEQQRLDLSEYLSASSDDAKLAKPISYQLKNLAGQSMGVRSILNQTVRTCSPVINKDLKLKVTLTDLLCIDEIDNGDNPDDYGLQQSIYYKANGEEITASSTDYKNYIPNSECNNVLSYKNNLLVCGDRFNNQIHVEKSRTRTGNINNSIILTITPEQLNDPNAVCSIHTYLKEFTTKGVGVFSSEDDKVLYNSRIDVKIQEVLAHLLNHSFENFTNSYYDNAITTRSDFYKYGTSGNVMWLAPGPNGSLEGPIRLGSIGEKAATWINFEILN